MTFARRGLGVKISFDLSRVGKRVKWDQSNRLIPGSLVVLVPNEDNEYKVDELVVATVAARPDSEAEQGRIDLFFARPEDIEIDTNKRWLMLEERAGFFEAQRYTLQALQRMVHES